MNQAQFMHDYNDKYRPRFTPQLFERNNLDLIDSIYQILKSCEIDRYFTLKLIKFDPILHYEEIYNTLRNHEEARRRKNSKVDNVYDYINIKETDIMLVRCIWLVRHNGLERQEDENKQVIEVVNPEEELEVLIALPRFVKGYYFKLSGNYYTSCFQIVDGSTYNNSASNRSKVDTVTMKTMFMPLRMFRSFRSVVDLNTNTEFKLIEYISIIFGTSCNAMNYLLACFGLYGACHLLQIDCLFLTTEPIVREDYASFATENFFINCPTMCLEDPTVQSLIATILAGSNKTTTLNDLYDPRYWLRNLGKAFKNGSVDKGLFLLDSIDRIYDNITKRDLHLKDEDKDDIFVIIRWMLREFSQLRLKENTDVSTKRIRIADYIGMVYATRLNRSLHRILDLGRRVTLRKVVQAVYTHPMFIIKNISNMSNLVAFRDMVNDNDAMVALKYTYKGISGLGEDGGSVQELYKYVDPSHVGILDLDASTTSDPGMSGMICPMTQIYGNSFTEYEEPDTWREQYLPLQSKFKEGTVEPVSINYDTEQETREKYKAIRQRIINEEFEFNQVTCPLVSLDNPNITFASCFQKIYSDNRDVHTESIFNLNNENINIDLSDI